MTCLQIRWQLNGFLNGSLPAAQEEHFRTHLETCSECANSLVRSSIAESGWIANAPALSPDFTDRVVARFPENPASARMIRYFFAALVSASLFAVAVFAFVRQYLLPDEFTSRLIQDAENATGAISFQWLSHLVSIPSVQYLLFSILAVSVSVVLICVIDLPKREKVTTR
jgi:hypothetical protein